MTSVCSKCFVGWQYLLLLKDNNFYCIKCLNIKTNHLEKYEKRRTLLCQNEIQNVSLIETTLLK
jgi:hypothetical protein